MMSPQAKLRLLRHTSWSGFVYIALLLIGMWPLAGFIPSQPANWSPAEIAEVYNSRIIDIRLGMVVALVGSMFYVPWTALLAKILARVEGGPGILTYCQLLAGGANVLLTAYPCGWWLIASFRPERDPQLIQLLNDIAWSQFLGVISPFYFVVISLIYGSLGDDSKQPILPRWVGYFNVWFLITLFPLNVIFFFKTGPFAWNGLFGFYLPFIIFFVWIFVMFYAIRQALTRIDDLDATEAAEAAASAARREGGQAFDGGAARPLLQG